MEERLSHPWLLFLACLSPVPAGSSLGSGMLTLVADLPVGHSPILGWGPSAAQPYSADSDPEGLVLGGGGLW